MFDASLMAKGEPTAATISSGQDPLESQPSLSDLPRQPLLTAGPNEPPIEKTDANNKPMTGSGALPSSSDPTPSPTWPSGFSLSSRPDCCVPATLENIKAALLPLHFHPMPV
ncbi:hypothetical protein PGTUg99_030735 [Puccinia graminis f. sp. tritici]|uniref:Uncharacterized protein n=1 Tax=Puccinia graminis f. sp. tritici TaxID=56615 RepID=A0A5B0R6K9_PUCGR|nr:hypothetical protein PGTUg99_030735 [Puccinia graminis f. sp. tritici]